jgi:carbonic anhydrase
LFICRNAGNIVPPHTNATGGMTASIEYAVAVLGVKHIIICGHSNCGAMKGALAPEALEDLPHVAEWLGHCRGAVEVLKERYQCAEEQHLDELIQGNVLLQIKHLETHPVVLAKLITHQLTIHGWVYNIETGEVDCCSGDKGTFEPFRLHYADLIRQI